MLPFCKHRHKKIVITAPVLSRDVPQSCGGGANEQRLAAIGCPSVLVPASVTDALVPASVTGDCLSFIYLFTFIFAYGEQISILSNICS